MRSICLHLEGIQLAAQCLFIIDQFDDCSALLEPLIYVEADESWMHSLVNRLRKLFSFNENTEINQMSAIYCIFGKCNDILDNRSRSLRSLTIAVLIDVACSEAAEHMVNSGMLSLTERRSFFSSVLKADCHTPQREWIIPFYEYLLLDQDPTYVDLISDNNNRNQQGSGTQSVSYQMNSASWLVRQAEFNFNHQFIEDAYRLARHAYTIDPFDNRGLIIYIASMVELKLKTELFYLGHELVNSYPKMALSWYCVGCYYWCCSKHEFAQKYILKATKMDKKFAKAWVMLGHVLSAQEESEQAISSYRTAIRLLPGDHRPMVYMAKELLRTNFLSLALHVLLGALELCPKDPGVLNELGVAYMKLGKLDSAIQHFEVAVHALENTEPKYNPHKVAGQAKQGREELKNRMFSFKKSCGFEIYNNYATALRKMDRFEEALVWYEKCLAANPSDASIFASKGFTLHLMGRLDSAIYCYHQALALQPKLAFCAEMVNRAMEDSAAFLSKDSDSSNRQQGEFIDFADAIAEPTNMPAKSMRDVSVSSSMMQSTQLSGISYCDEKVLEMSGVSGQSEEMFSPGSDASESLSMSRLVGRLSQGSEGGDDFN
eukprot:gene22778-31072_t